MSNKGAAMDELNDKLTRLLSSPEGMQKIQSAMAALGGMAEGMSTGDLTSTPPVSTAPPAPSATPAPPAAGGLAALLGGGTNGGDSGGLPDLNMLAKLAPLMGAFNQENDDTRLLNALRPYLHGEREQRLEDTMRFMTLTRLLPLLQEQGILGGGK